MGALTIAYCCNRCEHLPTFDFVWSAKTRRNGWLAHGARTAGTCEHDGDGCVKVLPHSEAPEVSVVFMAGVPAQGVTSTTLSVLNLANRFHVHNTHRSEAGRRVMQGWRWALRWSSWAAAKF